MHIVVGTWALACCLLSSAVFAQEGAPDDANPSRVLPGGAPPAGNVLEIRDWPARIAAADPGSKADAWAQAEFDDRDWGTMNLPAHWEEAGLPDYDGVVWFRRAVELDAKAAAGEAILTLGAIDDMDVTWVNGERVGGHEQPGDHYTPRVYKLKAGVLKEGRNVIAVRVMDHGWGGGLAETHGKMALKTSGGRIPLQGAWRYKTGASLAALTATSGRANTARPKRWGDGFELRDGDVVALAGGTGTVKQAEVGYLETLLTAATDARIAFREVAWQADTVYRQQRPLNFGSHLELLDRTHASVMVASFGQMEALDGATRLTSFVAAYEKLLDEFSQRTPRIVLVSPYRFEKKDNAHLPDLSAHNGDVAAYAEAIRQLAARRGYLFVDLAGFDPSGRTTDGVQLSPAGHRAWAEEVASQLLRRETLYDEGRLDRLREVIQHKNTLWRRHWRPANWAFLYGDRQHVPSSHDHRPGEPRWFPKEVDALIPMIEESEERIRDLQTNAR